MKTTQFNLATVSVLALACGSAVAGFSAPNSHSWPMEHVMVTFDGNAVSAHANNDASSAIQLLRFEGEDYSGASSVMDDTYYSDQYGWVPDGFISLGADEFLWIERVSSTAGLNVYEGGMRMMRDMHSYDAILGTDGSDDAWMWGGTMVHNWYSADDLGSYEVTYEVFVGDASGNAYSQYASDTVTLYFDAVPSPAGAAVLGLGGLVAARRRRA
ncbi:MAG: hypothetical protein ACSHX5_09540 [Phycisphaerales bacterium]